MRNSGSRDTLPEIRAALYLESIFASGRTSPNPSVACVATSDGFFFRGSTEVPGGRHAEIVTLDRVDAARGRFRLSGRAEGDPLRPFDLYVTLEPCSRYGRTPPCTMRIVQYRPDSEFARDTGYALRNVSFAFPDPSLGMEGRSRLEQAGLNVRDVGLPSLYAPFLAPFFQGLQARRPLFAVKVATDATGLLGVRGRSLNITGAAGRLLTMRLRARCDAVLVGPGTVAVDRPSLDLRGTLAAGEEGFRDHASFAWLEADVRRHRLAWFRGLFEPEGGWAEMDGDRGLYRQYQPTRVFLLGRPFSGSELFFERQRALEIQTGRPSVFLALRSHRSEWPGATVVPDIGDAAFLPLLGEELAGRGLQRILVESGRGMLAKWVSILGPEDMLLHVRSAHSIPVEQGETGLRLEDELHGLSVLDSMEFAEHLTVDALGVSPDALSRDAYGGHLP